jgi:hypothetical protein
MSYCYQTIKTNAESGEMARAPVFKIDKLRANEREESTSCGSGEMT